MSILSEARYLVKQYLMNTQKGCPVCGRSTRRQGDAHHLFVRRGPDIPELYTEINIILVCHNCHVPEAPELNYMSALMKLEIYGPDAIEGWLDSLPLKIKTLPSFYWEAREDYLNGTTTNMGR